MQFFRKRSARTGTQGNWSYDTDYKDREAQRHKGTTKAGESNAGFRCAFVPFVSPCLRNQYIPGAPPPIGGPAGALSSSGISETSASVVSISAEMDAAFCRAVRVTFAGSRIPAEIMSVYS